MEIKEFEYYPNAIVRTEYECPVCGVKSKDDMVVRKCAADHPRVNDIVGYADWWKDTNVPETLFVKDTSGRTLEYGFVKVLEVNVKEEKSDETN